MLAGKYKIFFHSCIVPLGLFVLCLNVHDIEKETSDSYVQDVSLLRVICPTSDLL